MQIGQSNMQGSPLPVFHLGENAGVFNSESQVISEAANEAAYVVHGIHDSVKSFIAACARTNTAIERFQHDDSAIKKFMSVLVAGRVLSEQEGRAELGSSKLSKLRQIGKHSDMLLRPEVLRLLQSGYSLIYQVTVLFEKLEGDEDAKVAEILRMFVEYEVLNREDLIKATKLVKRARLDAPAENNDLAPMETEFTTYTVPNLIESGQRFDLLFLTPSARDMRLLAEDYPDETILSHCLRLHEVVADNAVALVTARIRDLPIVANRLLPHCGFGRLSNVLLPCEPIQSDLVDAEVFIAAKRGKAVPIFVPERGWLKEYVSQDAVSIADQLTPSSVHKLHVFASAASAGWMSVVGDDCWIEKPSVR